MRSRLSGSTPNLTAAQQQELDQPNIQRGFDCTAAERAQQLRAARGNLGSNFFYKIFYNFVLQISL